MSTPDHSAPVRTRLILALTGASGMPFALALARAARSVDDLTLEMIISAAAYRVLAEEAGGGPADGQDELLEQAHVVHDEKDIGAGPASGSYPHLGMVVCPCSMASLGAIASGAGDGLIHRAADVCLKERRPLILCTRESPLSRIHLRNMTTAAEAGAIIMPLCPGFYFRPESIYDLTMQFAGRILSTLGLETPFARRWKDEGS